MTGTFTADGAWPSANSSFVRTSRYVQPPLLSSALAATASSCGTSAILLLGTRCRWRPRLAAAAASAASAASMQYLTSRFELGPTRGGLSESLRVLIITVLW
jgi:hypothetical protein